MSKLFLKEDWKINRYKITADRELEMMKFLIGFEILNTRSLKRKKTQFAEYGSFVGGRAQYGAEF